MHSRCNHKEKFDISPKFWEEFKNRGFELKVESGGAVKYSYSGDSIRKVKNQLFEIQMFPEQQRKITFVHGNTFIKTIYQIENMVKYKLFR